MKRKITRNNDTKCYTNIKSDENNLNSTNSKSRMCKFGYMDFIFLSTTISIAIAEDLEKNDIDILANFLAVLADQLALISSIEDSCSDDDKNEFTPPTTSTNRLRENSMKDSRTYYPNLKNKSKTKKVIRKKVLKKKNP